MSNPVRYYFSPSWMIATGSVFALSLVAFLGSAYFSFSQKFSFIPFVCASVAMILCFLSTYQFLKGLFSPTLQIFEKEIVVSRLRRYSIWLQDIEELTVIGTKVYLRFRDGDLKRELRFEVRQNSFEDLRLGPPKGGPRE